MALAREHSAGFFVGCFARGDALRMAFWRKGSNAELPLLHPGFVLRFRRPFTWFLGIQSDTFTTFLTFVFLTFN